MCADLGNLECEVKKLEKAKVDFLHIDVMDGHFVPNFTFGPDLVKQLHRISQIPLDIHLMVENPEKYIALWESKRKDVITFHIEVANQPQRIIQEIKSLGARASIALNPATPISTISYILKDLDMVLLMTVEPGFAGQKWIPSALKKVKRLNKMIQKENLDTCIQVDGNIGKHNISALKEAGASIFVGGSSMICMNPRYYQNVKKITKILKQ